MGSFSVVTLLFPFLLLVASGSLNITGFPNETTDLPTDGTNITSSGDFSTSSPFPTTSPSGFPNETTNQPTDGTNITTSGGYNTSTAVTIPPYSGSCKSPQPLCCAGQNNGCYRGCFCDQACMHFGDCCHDYKATCLGITTVDSKGTTPDVNNTVTLPPVTPVLFNSNGTTPVYNGIDPLNTTTWIPPSTAVTLDNSRSCRHDPPLCCMSSDWSCYRGCHCDVACLRRGDCCPDFKETCVTGFLNETTDLPTNGTSSGGFNASSQFPIWSLSGSCKSPQAMCCDGIDSSCYRGCFCDKVCRSYGDCCPDYNSTCSVSVLLNLNVRLRVPITASESEIQSALYTGATRFDQALQNRYSYYWYWQYNNKYISLRVTSIARKP